MTLQAGIEDPVKYFLDQFRAHAEDVCLIQDPIQLTYADLLSSLERRVEDLKEHGVHSESILLTIGESALHQVIEFFAATYLRATVAPLPDLPEARIDDIVNIIGATHVVRLGGSIYETGRKVDHPLITNLNRRQESGLIVLSSGTTGSKKAILHSVPRLMRKFTTRRLAYRTIAFLKMDHMGGINTVLHCLSNGGAVIFPTKRSVDYICDLIQRHKVELLPTTPTFLRLFLLSDFEADHDLSSLRAITYGTEVMPESTLTDLAKRLPHVKLQQTYGLSELGVLRSKSQSSTSLWVRLGGEGFQTKVVDGRLWIKAESAMEGYLNYPQPFEPDGWLDTGDRVEVDGEYFRVLGRESEIINVGGEKVFPSEVENYLLSLPNIAEAIVRSEPNPLTGNIVVADLALKEPEPPKEVVHRVKLSCKRNLPTFMVPVRIDVVSRISHTERFKKQRS